MREPLVLIARRRVRVTSARDVLATEPFIRLARDSWTGRFIDQVLREYSVQVQTVMELDMPDGIAEMVARGFGVSIIPMYDGRWLDDARLSIWRFGRPQLERGIGLAERRGNARSALTAALLQHLREVKISTRRTIRLKPMSLA